MPKLQRRPFTGAALRVLWLAAAYLYSPEMKQALGYLAPHQNPAGMFDAAEELESGIVDPVTARGPIHVRAE